MSNTNSKIIKLKIFNPNDKINKKLNAKLSTLLKHQKWWLPLITLTFKIGGNFIYLASLENQTVIVKDRRVTIESFIIANANTITT